MSCVASLPEYIKDIYKALLQVYKEAEDELAKDGRDYRIYYGIAKVNCNMINYWFIKRNSINNYC